MKYIKTFEDFVNESENNKPEDIINESEMVALYESAIEQESRLSSGITEILNQQILNELESSQMYRSMSAWMDDAGWINGSQLFFKYADEELGHMSKIYKYLYEKNCRAIVPASGEVQQEFKDVRLIAEAALEHEMKVTKNWNDIANKAKSEDDHDTYTLALSFVNEQREEEEKIRNILFQMDLDMPKWKIDELFKELL